MKFKVGDRVKATGEWDGRVFKEHIGTVLDDRVSCDGLEFAIEFDEDIDGHNCSTANKSGKFGYCWWVGEGLIELCEEDIKEDVTEEPKKESKCKFKVGDIIKGIDPDRYCWTDTSMTKAEVITVDGKYMIDDADMEIKVLEHDDGGCMIGVPFEVNSKYFALVDEEVCDTEVEPNEVQEVEGTEFLEKFEKGKTYVFDKETYYKAGGTSNFPWVTECDGKIVNVTSHDDATIDSGTFLPYMIMPKWCKEVKDVPEVETEDKCVDEDYPFIEEFEEGKTYVFSKEVMWKHPLTEIANSIMPITDWDNLCDGKVVKVISPRQGEIVSEDDGFTYKISSVWCKEVTDTVDEPIEVTEPTTPDEPKYYNGKVKCTDNTSNKNSFTVGKIYEFKDGQLTDDCGDLRPYWDRKIKTLDDMYTHGLDARFIEVEDDATDEVNEPTYYNGKVVCVRKNNTFVTEGKIYQFKNGLSIDDDGDPLPFSENPIKDVDHLNGKLSSEFIEVIE